MMRTTSSSTSSSEAAENPARAQWLRFAVTLVGVTLALLGAVVGVAYAVDPYDTGRSTLFEKRGVRPQGPRTANPSRGRDPAFNAAITGNSRIQIISPERLKETTGVDFVQLAVPGSGPKEHLALIDWFLRHRTEVPKALVVSVDDLWCTSDPDLPNDKPFPFWLYSADPMEYARGLLRYDILEELPRRLAYVFQDDPERARPDGYWDYEPDYIRLGYTNDPALRKRLEETPHADAPRLDRDPQEGQRRFPAVDRLKKVAATLPNETALILVMPPSYKNRLLPGTEQAFVNRACKAAVSAVAQAHARTAVVDWRVDRPENRNPELYFDTVHYRQPVAQAMEVDIADAIRRFE
jgi:hypothetical protein